MKSILIVAGIWIASFIPASSQDLPALKFVSISADWKIVGRSGIDLSKDQIFMLAKNPSLFTPIELSNYHPGRYQFTYSSPVGIYEAPRGPVNTNSLLIAARFDFSLSFALLNHKTSEYRKKGELVLGIFYQLWRYHQSSYVRTDTITPDSLSLNFAYYDEWSPMAGVQGAYLFITNPDKWISAYAGTGAGVAVSVHPQIAETYGVISAKIIDTVLFPTYTFPFIRRTQNTFPAKPSVLLEGKIPFGVAFNIIGQVSLFLQGEIVGSKQIYFQKAPSSPVKISFAESAGLKLKF